MKVDVLSFIGTFQECHHIENGKEFYIADDAPGKPSYVYNHSRAYHPFTVINAKESSITFLAIDQCVYKGKDKKRCDFALVHKKELCFVEIKDTERARPRTLTNAINQLETTLADFLDKSDLGGVRLEAIVSFRNVPLVPRATTIMQNERIRF